MQRLGKSQIALTFEAAGAREQDGQAAHKEAGAMCAPYIRLDTTRGAEFEQVILILPAERVWQVLAVVDGGRYRNQGVARRLGQ